MPCLSPSTIRASLFVGADDTLGIVNFSDDVIREAMKNAARSYNGMPPISLKVTGNCLPDETDMFINGTIYWLYTGQIAVLRRNDPGVAREGGVEQDTKRRLADSLERLAMNHYNMFVTTVKASKANRNMAQGFGTF